MSGFAGKHLPLEVRLQPHRCSFKIHHQIYMKPDAYYVSRSGMNKVVEGGSLLLLFTHQNWQKSLQLIIGL